MPSREIYAHVFLPGEFKAVPAGLLAIEQGGRRASGRFFYGQHYVERIKAFALDPEVLPLVAGVDYLQPERDVELGGGLFLAFQDALPDGWGRRVIAADHGGVIPDDVTLLLEANDARAGAMVFSATREWSLEKEPEERASLEDIAGAVRSLELGIDTPLHLKRLLRRGSSIGGTQPKTQITQDGSIWLAKFRARTDEVDYPTLEAVTTELARRAGIRVPDYRLVPVGSERALLLARFDRGPLAKHEAFTRRHFLSAATLTNTPYTSSDGSYLSLADAVRKRSVRAREDLIELFRRVVFNILVDNSDDHLKNHGMLHVKADLYELSPAFDLAMQLTNLGYQQLIVGPQGTHATVTNALAGAPRFGLETTQALSIIEEVRAALAEWNTVLKILDADRALHQRVGATLQARARDASKTS